MFESRFCNPGKGHENGLTEGLVGYSRRNWLVPPPAHASWDDMNAYLLEASHDEGERRLRGMEQTIAEALARQRGHLLPVAARRFPCCVLRPSRADGFGLVAFETSRYSVPAVHAHEKLRLRTFVDRVEISNGHQVLALHPRCYQREQDILDPLHYLSLLEQRLGAWDQAKPIQEWRQQWPRVYERYLNALRKRLPRPQATRESVHILQLHEGCPEKVIAQALEEALEGHCYSPDGV